MNTRLVTASLHSLAFVAIVSLLLVGTPSAFAQPTTFTDTHQHVTEVLPGDINPCTGDTATVTLTYNAVFHVTEFKDGRYHITGTQTGSFTAVPDDPTLDTQTGHFTVSFSENVNKQNQTSTTTVTVRGRSADGTKVGWHILEHFNVSASGVKVAFDKLVCA